MKMATHVISNIHDSIIMKQSDIMYIKAMLWAIVDLCYVGQGADLSNPILWVAIAYVILYGIGFVYYRYKEDHT